MRTRVRPAPSTLHRGYIHTSTRRGSAPYTCTAASSYNRDCCTHLTTSTVSTMPPRGGGFGRGRSDANADANMDKEGEARKGGDLGEDKQLIGRGGDDTVDAVGGHCRGRDGGRGGELDKAPA